MTENLLQRLEERMMSLLTELETRRKAEESLRAEVTMLRQERDTLIQTRESQQQERMKLEERVKNIISLLETMDTTSNKVVNMHTQSAQVQG